MTTVDASLKVDASTLVVDHFSVRSVWCAFNLTILGTPSLHILSFLVPFYENQTDTTSTSASSQRLSISYWIDPHDNHVIVPMSTPRVALVSFCSKVVVVLHSRSSYGLLEPVVCGIQNCPN